MNEVTILWFGATVCALGAVMFGRVYARRSRWLNQPLSLGLFCASFAGAGLCTQAALKLSLDAAALADLLVVSAVAGFILAMAFAAIAEFSWKANIFRGAGLGALAFGAIALSSFAWQVTVT